MLQNTLQLSPMFALPEFPGLGKYLMFWKWFQVWELPGVNILLK